MTGTDVRRDVTTILAGATAAGLTVFVTAVTLWGLLWRLEDVAGVYWSGWLAVAAAGVTVATTAGVVLSQFADRRRDGA